MTRFPTLLTLVALIAPAALSAQGFHRNLPLGTSMVGLCEPSSDGGLFAHFIFHPGAPLVKLNAQGEFVWGRSMPQLTGIIPDQNGGVIALRPSDGIPLPSGSTYNPFLLQWIDADGQMQANRRIMITYGWAEDHYDRLDGYAWTPSGEFYITLESSTDDPKLLKFDAQGVLLWSITTIQINSTPMRIRVAPDGGVIAHESTVSPFGIGTFMRIDPNGQSLWAFEVNMTDPDLSMTSNAMLVDNTGNAYYAFTANGGANGEEPWVVFSKIDLSGSLAWTRSYRRAGSDSLATMDNASIGRVLPDGNIFFGSTQGFEITPDGIFRRERICTTPTYAPGLDSLRHQFSTFPTTDGWVQHGIRRWWSETSGNFVQLPILGRTPIDLGSTCFWNCNERDDIIPIPSATNPCFFLNFNYTPTLDQVSVEDWPIEPFVTATLGAFDDACDLPEIVEFFNHIDDLEALGSLPLFPNPVPAGQTIRVNTDGQGMLEVLDARGRMISRQPFVSQPATLSTQHLDAGIYLVRATRQDGSVMGTGRFVVQ